MNNQLFLILLTISATTFCPEPSRPRSRTVHSLQGPVFLNLSNMPLVTEDGPKAPRLGLTERPNSRKLSGARRPESRKSPIPGTPFPALSQVAEIEDAFFEVMLHLKSRNDARKIEAK